MSRKFSGPWRYWVADKLLLMACCIANRIGVCYAAGIPSKMLALQDTGEAQ